MDSVSANVRYPMFDPAFLTVCQCTAQVYLEAERHILALRPSHRMSAPSMATNPGKDQQLRASLNVLICNIYFGLSGVVFTRLK